MMRLKSKQTSLRDNIRRSFLLLSVVTILIISFLFFVKEIYNIQNSLTERIVSISSILSRNISAALAFDDKDEIYKVLTSVGEEKYIHSVRVYNADQSEVAVFPSEFILIGEMLPEFSKSTHSYIKWPTFNYCQRVIEKSDELGTVCISANLPVFLKTIVLDWVVLLLASLISLVVAILLSSKLQRALTAPIDILISSVRRVSQEGDYEIRVDFKDQAKKEIPAEISYLTEEFNKMLDLVERRDYEIRKTNEHLEVLVEKRTTERDSERQVAVQASKMSDLGIMSAGIAHEINNPLAAIKGSANLLEKMVAKGNINTDLLNKMSGDIVRLVERISKIVKGLRNFSREAGNDPFVVQELFNVIDDTVVFCNKRFQNNNVLLDIQCPEIGYPIACRATQLSQVFLNLLNNAFDAIEKNEERWVRLTVEKDEHFTIVKIRDSGHGIPKEVQAKIFQPFYTTKEVGKGTGLGLSISVGIIKTHLGDIYVDNEDKHTCFVIKFPNNHELLLAKNASLSDLKENQG